MFFDFLKKDKYFDCYNIKHTIHFFHDNIRACCSNVDGPVFYENYNGAPVDWNFIYNKRKEFVKKINSFTNKEDYPSCCKNCFEIPTMYSKSKIEDFPNMVNKVFIQTNMSCNAKCVYCVFKGVNKSYRYRVLPLINSMIENNILSKDAMCYLSGGEITISPEFEELFSTLANYLNSQIEILTSCIKYSKSIENAFVQNKCLMVVSPDSAAKETYKKIKQVDCFDKVIDNIKNYVKASDYAKNAITMKYILVDGINDNKKEITDFVHLVNDLGLRNVRMDIDYVKYSFVQGKKVPQHYFELYNVFNALSKELNLKVQINEQTEAILKKEGN